MATKNLIDDTSTAVTTATPGVQLDLRYRTTLSRAALGVPVRFWAYAESTVANDTGTVQILDSAGAAQLTIPVTGTTAQWYVTDGYLPATDAKYDAHYGGNTLGTLKAYAFSIYEFADISPLEGVLAATISLPAIAATGTVASGDISGDLTQTIALPSIVATGTVVSPIPAYVSAGTAASGTGSLTPAVPASVGADDIELLVVNNTYTITADATLSDAQGFAAVTGGAGNSGDYSGIRSHLTLFWRRGGGTAPTVADNGEFNAARIYRFTGCITSGNPWNVVAFDGDNDGNSTMTAANGATTTVDNTLVCVFVTAFTNGDATLASWTNADLEGIIERDDTNYLIGGDRVHIALMTGEKATAAAYGSTTATWSTGAYWVGASLSIALKPV